MTSPLRELGRRATARLAGPTGAESMVRRLGGATIRSADCQELSTLVTSLSTGDLTVTEG